MSSPLRQQLRQSRDLQAQPQPRELDARRRVGQRHRIGLCAVCLRPVHLHVGRRNEFLACAAWGRDVHVA